MQFGTITPNNPLNLDFNDDFSIDLSNIKFIDKLIINNSIYQIDIDKSYELKKFNINKLINLK